MCKQNVHIFCWARNTQPRVSMSPLVTEISLKSAVSSEVNGGGGAAWAQVLWGGLRNKCVILNLKIR